MRVQANPGVGELGHVGFADDHGASPAQATDHHGIARRRCGIAQQGRASGGDFAGHVEQILDRHNATVQRPQQATQLRTPVGRLGCGAGLVDVQPSENA